jgi:hypothetical protein
MEGKTIEERVEILERITESKTIEIVKKGYTNDDMLSFAEHCYLNNIQPTYEELYLYNKINDPNETK